MAVSKEFLEAMSNDGDLKSEVERATFGALDELLKEKGIEEEAARAMEAAMEKVAASHGFESADPDDLGLDDLEGVSGGMKIEIVNPRKDIRPLNHIIYGTILD